MEHIMIDLETLGKSPGCVILSLAAVPFEPNGGRGEGRQWNIDIQSCLDRGLLINGETLAWWLGQTPALLRRMMRDPYDICQVLGEFSEFMACTGATFVWSHGSTFDIPILDAAYEASGMHCPWHYRNVRDTRTLFWLAKEAGYKYDRVAATNMHDPLADACRQIGWVQEAYALLRYGWGKGGQR